MHDRLIVMHNYQLKDLVIESLASLILRNNYVDLLVWRFKFSSLSIYSIPRLMLMDSFFHNLALLIGTRLLLLFQNSYLWTHFYYELGLAIPSNEQQKCKFSLLVHCLVSNNFCIQICREEIKDFARIQTLWLQNENFQVFKMVYLLACLKEPKGFSILMRVM